MENTGKTVTLEAFDQRQQSPLAYRIGYIVGYLEALTAGYPRLAAINAVLLLLILVVVVRLWS